MDQTDPHYTWYFQKTLYMAEDQVVRALSWVPWAQWSGKTETANSSDRWGLIETKMSRHAFFGCLFFSQMGCFLKLHSKCDQRGGPEPVLEADEWTSGNVMASWDHIWHHLWNHQPWLNQVSTQLISKYPLLHPHLSSSASAANFCNNLHQKERFPQ